MNRIESRMNYLKENNFYTITLDEYRNWLDGKIRLKETDIPSQIHYSNEFFKDTSCNDVKDAIKNIKENYKENSNKYQFYDANKNLPEIFEFKREEKEWKIRPNQKKAINNFIKAKEKGRKKKYLKKKPHNFCKKQGGFPKNKKIKVCL